MTAPASASPNYIVRLNRILRTMHEAERFDDALPALEMPILELLGAERLTIYQRDRDGKHIVSRYKTGQEFREIRVAIGTSSISGFVAMTRQSVHLADVYDKEALARIHPDLTFDTRYDQRSGYRTHSMVVVPIVMQDTLLGVLQLINRRDGGEFTEVECQRTEELAELIAQKFQYDFQTTRGPYHHLIKCGRLTQAQLEDYTRRAEQGEASIPALMARELGIRPEEVGASLERFYLVPFMAYDSAITVAQDALKKVSTNFLRNNAAVPLVNKDGRLILLAENPNDTSTMMALTQAIGLRTPEVRVGLRDDILRYLSPGKDTSAPGIDLDELVSKMSDTVLEIADDKPAEEGNVNEETAAVVQLVNRLIVDANRMRASDIHIEPAKDRTPATVRMRVDGVCRRVLNIPSTHIQAVVARIKVLSRLDIAERRKPQDGKFAIRMGQQVQEVRVATLPTVHGESAVLRLLASGGPIPFDKLNLSKRNHAEVEKLIGHPHGLFLVVGPTGSGKTTSLHSVLGRLNTPERKIWTAEDPVEITQPGLQQVQVVQKIGFTFAAALRAFLRADPDVILIGEMRDQETAHAGIEASLTGHLVLSTLHTNSAPETITRLLDMGLDPVSFADALLGVLAQRLMRTLCPDCKKPRPMTDAEHEYFVRHLSPSYLEERGMQRDGATLMEAVGCDNCGGTGYRGRIGIHELLVGTDGIRKLIYQQATVTELAKLARSEGMTTLMQDALEKVLNGFSDMFQLHRVVAE